MIRDQRHGSHSPNPQAVTVGVPLAGLWAFHAAATDAPGAGYVRLPIVFGMATAFLVWRLSARYTGRRSAHKNGVTLGFCCWGIAATFSAIVHWHSAQVPLTYLSVFLAGSAVYIALSGLRFTPADLDAAVVGLAVGTLFSIGASLVAVIQGSLTGSPANMAGVLVIVAPILVATACEHRKGIALRVFSGAMLIPIALTFFVLQQRAAFVTMSLVIPVVCMFKLGVKRLPVAAAAFTLGAGALVYRLEPELVSSAAARMMPAIAAATGDPLSSTWLMGDGPGAGSVHGLETGILGLLGLLLLAAGIGTSLCRVVTRGREDGVNDTRFMLIIGPAAYLVYSLLTDSTPDNAGVTTWAVLMASMLALMPPFGRRIREERPVEAAVPARSTPPRRFVQRPQSFPSLAR